MHDKKREVYAKLLAPILALHLQIIKHDVDQPEHKVVLDQMTTQMVDATTVTEWTGILGGVAMST